MRFAVRIHQSGWTYSQLETVWAESERLGYDAASLYDVLGAPGPECWTALTALTRATGKLIAVPLVLANPYRHPAVMAKMAATLDELSGGRIILGVGAGGSDADAAAFGMPWPSPGQRIAALGEAVEVMRTLWRGGGSFAGRRYQLRDAPGYPGAGPPARPEGPPILIGGHGPDLLRLAARHADLCNVGFDLSPDDWHDLRRRLADYAREDGRAPDSLTLTHNATVLLGADEAHVAKQVSEWAHRRGLTEDAARTRLRHSLHGTPSQVREQLRHLEAAGVSWVFVLFDDLPSLGGLRSFAELVMPGMHDGDRDLLPGRRRAIDPTSRPGQYQVMESVAVTREGVNHMDKTFMDRTFKAPDGSVWARVFGGTMLHDGRHVVGIELFDDTEGVSLMVDPREALELADAILDAAAVGEANAA